MGDCEDINELENEYPGECSAKVGNGSEEGHIGAANRGVCDLGMKRGYSDKHDGGAKGREDVLGDDHKKVPGFNTVFGEDCNGNVRNHGSKETTNKGIRPQSHWLEISTPLAGVISQCDFKREVYQNSKSQILLRKAKIKKFEVGNGIVRLETDFANQMNNNEGLDI